MRSTSAIEMRGCGDGMAKNCRRIWRLVLRLEYLATPQGPKKPGPLRGIRLLAGIQKTLDLSPILANHEIGTNVAAAGQRLKGNSCDLRKAPTGFMGHIGIVFGMNDQYFRGRDFIAVMPGAIEVATQKFVPVFL